MLSPCALHVTNFGHHNPTAGMRTATQPFHFTVLLGSDNGVWHLNSLTFMDFFHRMSRNLGLSQKSCGIRRGSAAARLLELRVWIPPGVWMFVSRVVCCHAEVSGSGWSFIQRSSTECVYVCVCLIVISKPQQWGGLGPLGLSNYEKIALKYKPLRLGDTIGRPTSSVMLFPKTK
jgi:hypothetical protein